jgi:hypothetical protein
MCTIVVTLRWVRNLQVCKELEVHKFEERLVELKEGCHDLVVDIEGQALVELVRGDPSDLLAHDFHLIVNTLDGEEGLLEALGDSAVQHELLN